MTASVARPPTGRRKRLFLRLIGGLGLLLILLAGISIVAAMSGGSAPDRGDTYVWRTGSELFIGNNSDHEAADCTLVGATGNRWVTVDHRPNSFFENFHTNGKWAKRFESGPIAVTCSTSEVNISSGPVIQLYPIAATPWPFLAGIVLICIWRVSSPRGGRAPRR